MELLDAYYKYFIILILHVSAAYVIQFSSIRAFLKCDHNTLDISGILEQQFEGLLILKDTADSW